MSEPQRRLIVVLAATACARRLARRLPALALTLGLAACGGAPELPPARPLAATPAALASIPALQPGPHAVQASAATTLTFGERPLRLRVVAPAGPGPFPLVLFSHGFASDVDKYDALLTHWASHGYIGVAPYHRDGGGSLRAIFNSLRLGNEALIAERLADLRAVLEHLDALDGALPGLAARIDRARIAAAGHSFGAFSAQQLGGAIAEQPGGGRSIEGRDLRVRAVVAISPPGPMFELIHRESWRGMQAPMLATTGTWDVDGRFVHHWREHALSFETAPPGRNWLLVVEGADHYLGNLICRPERDAAPQTDALRLVNAAAVTFLDAQLRGDAAAATFLSARPLAELTGGFAQLEHR